MFEILKRKKASVEELRGSYQSIDKTKQELIEKRAGIESDLTQLLQADLSGEQVKQNDIKKCRDLLSDIDSRITAHSYASFGVESAYNKPSSPNWRLAASNKCSSSDLRGDKESK